MKLYQQVSLMCLALGCFGSAVAVLANHAAATPKDSDAGQPVLIALSVGNTIRLLPYGVKPSAPAAAGDQAHLDVSYRTLSCVHLMQTTLISFGLDCRESETR